MTKTITIRIKPSKVSIGHQKHTTGTGVHNDKRQKRQRTRQAQRSAWQKLNR